MAEEMGLARWLNLTPDKQKIYLAQAQEKHFEELGSLSYSETLKQTHQLLRLMDYLPIPERQDHPVGLGLILES